MGSERHGEDFAFRATPGTPCTFLKNPEIYLPDYIFTEDSTYDTSTLKKIHVPDQFEAISSVSAVKDSCRSRNLVLGY